MPRCKRPLINLFFVALAVTIVTHAGWQAAAQEIRLQESATEDETSALQVINKNFDGASGELSIVLLNRSDLDITSFAVLVVSSDELGNGTTTLHGQEMFPGEPLTPGASHEMKFSLNQTSSSKLSARAVKLEYEIRSDRSSFGNTELIDDVFLRRAAYLVEMDKALARLRQGQESPNLHPPVVPLLKKEKERGQEAQRLLLAFPFEVKTPLETSRWSALSNVGDLAAQTLKIIEEGGSLDRAASNLEQLLASEVAHASKHVRPDDIARYQR